MARHAALLVMTGVMAAAIPAAAQNPHDPDPTLVVRERVRDVVRGSGRVDAPARYQGRDRGPERTERFSRRVKLGRDGRFSVANIAGNITVTGGSGDDVSIEAVKRTRGDASELASIEIIVDERPGRVDVKTERGGRSDRVAVDYTIIVPASASVDINSVSGNVKVASVQGPLRAETISGSINTLKTPRLQTAKTVSGDVELADAAPDAELSASSVSGTIRAKGLKVRSLELGTVSGDVMLTDVACERLGVRSVSGSVEYAGSLAPRGRYEINSHSGNVRLALGSDVGFELTASSFSGNIRSDLPLTLGSSSSASSSASRDGRERRGGMNRATRGVFGDGSASLNIRTFSGDVIITKR
jgi:DUF4097 and DUF4098 domain-containing protein YvlB